MRLKCGCSSYPLLKLFFYLDKVHPLLEPGWNYSMRKIPIGEVSIIFTLLSLALIQICSANKIRSGTHQLDALFVIGNAEEYVYLNT